MKNDNYLDNLRKMRKDNLDQAEEYFDKYLNSDDEMEKQRYNDLAMMCIGIAQGISKAIALFKIM